MASDAFFVGGGVVFFDWLVDVLDSRIAAPMVGGMISSTVLTLAVIPAIYALVIPFAVEFDLFSCRRGLGRAARASPRLQILQSGQFQPRKE